MLLMDPDERLYADEDRLRSRLDVGAPVAAFDVVYRLSVLDVPLPNTYANLRKSKLVRPERCSWGTALHSLPFPTEPHWTIEPIEPDILCITSDLAHDLTRRLDHHVRWARLESAGISEPVGLGRLLDAIAAPLDEYTEGRNCLADGTAGLAVGMLHVVKEINRALFEASNAGFAPPSPSELDRLKRVLAEILRR